MHKFSRNSLLGDIRIIISDYRLSNMALKELGPKRRVSYVAALWL